jgi:hypothetical protein
MEDECAKDLSPNASSDNSPAEKGFMSDKLS